MINLYSCFCNARNKYIELTWPIYRYATPALITDILVQPSGLFGTNDTRVKNWALTHSILACGQS